MTSRAAAAAGAAMLAAWSGAASANEGIETSYLYNLSGFTGTIPMSWPALAFDGENKELYAVDGGLVRIFNLAGMEIYRYGEDTALGYVYDMAPLPGGDQAVLKIESEGKVVIRCDYRGTPVGKIAIHGLPPDLAKTFDPTLLRQSGGKLYLANRGEMLVVVTDVEGKYLDSYDLAALVGLDEKGKADTGIRGFSVDRDGNILFTISPLFRAFVVSADRQVRTFGTKGSRPGRFGIVGGITRGDDGHIYVSDLLRSVVLMFDFDSLGFIREFGHRGWREGGLIAPLEIAAGAGKVFVAQSARRGVSVFSVRTAAAERPN
jgi:DNA-binding beta-propeller fold protein YncE